MDPLSGVWVFAKVVEKNGFSAAARDLGLSPSAVSQYVSRLETRLGARLLNRTTRQVNLTEIGSSYYDHVRRILDEAEMAELTTSQFGASPRGVLRVSAPLSLGRTHIARAIPDFIAQYPDISVELDMTDKLIDIVDERFDLAIRFGSLPSSSLIARKIAPIHVVPCCSPEYISKHGEPQTPSDLEERNCMMLSIGTLHGHWTLVGEDSTQTVAISGNFVTNDVTALEEAALGGLGIAALPTYGAAANLHSGKLVRILGDFRMPALTAHFIYPHSHLVSPKVRAFIDFIIGRFGPKPYWDKDM